jgi:hypothetical protein
MRIRQKFQGDSPVSGASGGRLERMQPITRLTREWLLILSGGRLAAVQRKPASGPGFSEIDVKTPSPAGRGAIAGIHEQIVAAVAPSNREGGLGGLHHAVELGMATRGVRLLSQRKCGELPRPRMRGRVAFANSRPAAPNSAHSAVVVPTAPGRGTDLGLLHRDRCLNSWSRTRADLEASELVLDDVDVEAFGPLKDA